MVIDIPNEQWEHLKSLSEKSRRHWNVSNEWWNTKFYRNNPPNDGNLQQISLKGEHEIPYQRELFYLSKSRFALNNISVAYFSSNLSIMCCETIKIIKESYNCSWREYLEPYLNGVSNPDNESFGYPLNFRLLDDTNIIDLRKDSEALQLLEKLINNISTLAYSINDNYKHSRIIADAIHKKGFDGIIYSSIREPIDMNLCGYNIVVFNKSKISAWR